MKTLLSIALFIAAAIAVHADVVIEQKAESAMMNGKMILKIKGDLARMDMADSATVIMNLKTGDMTTLMHQPKVIMRMNMNTLKQQAEATQRAAGIDPAAVATPKATGVTEKVGDWTAQVYEFTVGDMKGKLWAAKDFPNAQVLKDALKKVTGANTGGFDPNKMDVPGMVVKYEMTTPFGPMVSTLVKATEQPVADSEFVVPQGYSEMAAPAIPAIPKN